MKYDCHIRSLMIELVDITVSVFMDVQTFFKYMDLKIYSASFPPWPFFREIRISNLENLRNVHVCYRVRSCYCSCFCSCYYVRYHVCYYFQVLNVGWITVQFMHHNLGEEQRWRSTLKTVLSCLWENIALKLSTERKYVDTLLM